MNLMLRMKEIEGRLQEIRTASGTETDVEKLGALESECDSLQEERSSLIKKFSTGCRDWGIRK